MVDIHASGSYREMYWWDVIHHMYSEHEADRARGDSDDGQGPKKRKAGSRSKPKLQSERKKHS